MDFLGLQLQYLPASSTIQIEGRVTIFELFSIVGLIVAIVSLAIAVRAARDNARTRRAEFSFRVWQAFMQDDVQSAYLDIEWGRFKYGEGHTGFTSDAQERGMDRLLYLLDEVALLVETGILTKADFRKWSYQGVRVLGDENVRNYLAFLDGFFQSNGIDRRPHDDARRVFAPTI